MDAREVLRRYLEQRREQGESELVLDGLRVEEVMHLIGAGVRTGEGAIARGTHGAREATSPANPDWRASLRGAGVTVPQPPESRPRQSVEITANAQQTDDMPFRKGLVIASAEAELIPGAIQKVRSLGEIAEKIEKCTRCTLYKTATRGVPGEGDPKAKLVCVGEAPGAKEDETGRPFVGQAGQLLTKILAAIDLTREQVFIANVLKHRPPGNRNPRPEEVEACGPYLIRQLELIEPRVIVAFGTFAAQTLLQTRTPIGQLRGLVHRYHGIPLIVTYHPAALLRNPAWKRPTWEDVKLARRILDSATRA